MKVKCIKTYDAHWGIFFEQDDWYNVTEIVDKKVEVITDYKKYMYELKSFLNLTKPYIGKKLTEEEIQDLQRINKRVSDKDIYRRKVEIPFYNILDQDSVNHFFCYLTKLEVEELYGSHHFDTTVHFFEDYFIHQDVIRNEIINSLFEKN